MPPLAERLRPQSLDEVAGQPLLLGEGRPLRNIILSGQIPNLIFYGPPGIGKTTLANIIAKRTDRLLIKLNGTTAGTADIKAAVAKLDTLLAPGGILLYLDEIQYLNKKQQQTLLEHLEKGSITLIASTTENPFFYIYHALLSRATVFEFRPLTPEDIAPVVERGFACLAEESATKADIAPGVVAHIATACGGDVRKALNATELCFLATGQMRGDAPRPITLELAQSLTQKSALRYDKDGDGHYDAVSAYQKSLRGSDPDAALHYLARLLEAGDLPSAIRRLMVCACEDVGLAYPQIIPIVRAACEIAQAVGLPEARIPLADAVVLVATAPKSNSAYLAIDAALADVRAGKGGVVPRNLQNVHADGAEREQHGQHYVYPHDFPDHWTAQQYLPDELLGTQYYHPGENKIEQAAAAYWQRVRHED
ncbi:MAG: replication-associated recombination protein A [Oscillospiraceae bacterium]|jgi:putative ATPase|nr:replication-associated recombination protein A [Oscillospiraceae bacterium]